MSRFKCPQCPKVCKNGTGLAAHMRSHAPRTATSNRQLEIQPTAAELVDHEPNQQVVRVIHPLEHAQRVVEELPKVENIVLLAQMLVYIDNARNAIEARMAQVLKADQ